MAELKDFAYFVSSSSDVSEVLPFLFYLAFSEKKPPFNILGIFFLLSGAIKIFTLISAELYINNMPAYHLLAAIEILSVYFFYSTLIAKRIIYPGALILLAIQLINSFALQPILTFNSISWTINMMVIIVIGMIFFYNIYNEEGETSSLLSRPEFIITCGWLVYASGSLFTYLMGTEILSGKPEGFFKNAWIFQCFSNILKNIIISYGFFLTRKKCLT